MIKIFVFFTLTITINFSCKAQVLEPNYIPPATSSESPYYIEQRDLNIKLPDSLNHGMKGKLGIILFIDDNKKINGFNIRYLKLYKNDSLEINYYKYLATKISCDDYPIEIKDYCSYFENIYSELPIIQNLNVVPDKNNVIIFIFNIQ